MNRRRILIPSVLAAVVLLAAAPPQEQPAKKPKSDYMSKLLNSRTTTPLGLKENPLLEKMLKQSGTKWAIRSGFRHILD